ncbi:hypothetical protein JOF56_011396 [Kibdelosporangium banguiense]|uniref:Uncharacterized protein n=1 Tax=Kibdelosporangium banguiense TaxID=1365924 RepID=A0ABS4U2Y7_9PSEU|nr:hypothetical protein [Kibdelosporangium banguiense]MBP2331011.1 hypothetical protein [Kibdelosporangium banguiense]
MSWTSSDDVRVNVALTVGPDTEVKFLVSERYPDDITLVVGDSVVEVIFEPSAVEALRDKADEALRCSRAMHP